ELVELVASAMGERRPSRALPDLAKRLAGRSEAMTRIRERVSGLAPLWTPVLVSGEPGTGRDSVVLAIHELGASAGRELLKIDAASFTPGDRIPAAGALYLDGVGSLTPKAQVHWAERLAKGEAGGHRRGVRFLASTSDHLLSRVRDGSFNADLGTALLRFSIELPPLRDRPEDIPDVADSLVEKIGASVGRKIRLSGAAREFISTRRWPGNARQLQQLLERAIAFSRGRQIRRQVVEEVFAELEQTLASIREQHSIRERAAVLRAIEQTGGNISHAAEILGRSRSAVYRLIRKHGIALTRSG
ncbi:MAG: sigma 54-interacting transcriptional regulator, partial [Myxococcota bacterium]